MLSEAPPVLECRGLSRTLIVMDGLLVGFIVAVVLSICAFLSLIAVKPKAIAVRDNLHDSAQ